MLNASEFECLLIVVGMALAARLWISRLCFLHSDHWVHSSHTNTSTALPSEHHIILCAKSLCRARYRGYVHGPGESHEHRWNGSVRRQTTTDNQTMNCPSVGSGAWWVRSGVVFRRILHSSKAPRRCTITNSPLLYLLLRLQMCYNFFVYIFDIIYLTMYVSSWNIAQTTALTKMNLLTNIWFVYTFE